MDIVPLTLNYYYYYYVRLKILKWCYMQMIDIGGIHWCFQCLTWWKLWLLYNNRQFKFAYLHFVALLFSTFKHLHQPKQKDHFVCNWFVFIQTKTRYKCGKLTTFQTLTPSMFVIKLSFFFLSSLSSVELFTTHSTVNCRLHFSFLEVISIDEWLSFFSLSS